MKTTLIVAILVALLIGNTPKPVFDEFQAALGLTLPAAKTARAQMVADKPNGTRYKVMFIMAQEHEGGIKVIMILADANAKVHDLVFLVKGAKIKDIMGVNNVELVHKGGQVTEITAYSREKKVFSCKFENVMPPDTVMNTIRAQSLDF